jgi:hypothetical protein
MLQLCELFHCRPSELESEDGLLLLRLLNMRHWRDVASYYDDDPDSTMVSDEDRKRLMFLAMGVTDALSIPVNALSAERLASADPRRIFKLGESKKEQLKSQGQKFTKELDDS